MTTYKPISLTAYTEQEVHTLDTLLEWFKTYQDQYQIKMTKRSTSKGDSGYYFDVWQIDNPYEAICLAKVTDE